MKINKNIKILPIILTVAILLSSCALFVFDDEQSGDISSGLNYSIPEYSFDEDWLTRPFLISEDLKTPPYVDKATATYSGLSDIELNNNIPYFGTDGILPNVFMRLSPLDEYNRAGMCVCCVGKETLCDDDRDDKRSFEPPGWHSVKYDIISSGYLYHRCHILAYSLTGNINDPQNVITGTAYFNTSGMLKYETSIINYIRKTGHHVLYRVTPVYIDDELIARGVIMEAFSVEDEGDGVCFCVLVYNVQPGIRIDYLTGESSLE